MMPAVARWVIPLFALLLCAQAEGVSGKYAGTWTGGTAEGEFHLSLWLKGREWQGEVTFTLGGNTVPTQMTMLKVEGASLAAKYEFELGGNKLQSAIEGELRNGTWEGKYKTTVPGTDQQVDEGTWKASKSG